MKRLIANGDSWTFGTEIIDPEIKNKFRTAQLNKLILVIGNRPYRLANIWPTHLANHFNAESVNLGHQGDCNNAIAERTIDYIARHDLRGPDNFVVIGWTAPERTYYYMNPVGNRKLRTVISAASLEQEQHQPAIDFLSVHFSHMILPEEYWTRYARTVVLLEQFLKSRDIPYLMFNAFYSQDSFAGTDWRCLQDVNVREAIASLRPMTYQYTQGNDLLEMEESWAANLWDSVDPVRWYRKDQKQSSFRSYVSSVMDSPFVEMHHGHPNEQAHRLWADELKNYILENNLLASKT